ncbi:MAG: EamA family transporter RarD [Deltaproteobacteria bacterium]|nr:MAG: EamA family transporter RarD [Deltaproteobacteria bacterium]
MDRVEPNISDAKGDEARKGVFYGILAYLLWGVFPLYFKALSHVAPLEVLSHRIVWSVVTLAVVLLFFGGLKAVKEILSSPRKVGALTFTALLLSVNWLVFIWAVEVGRVSQASLGYYINPLVNVLLGAIFLKERLSKAQTLAIALAASGVGILAWSTGAIPLTSLALAFSFGGYGLVRKLNPSVKALPGLTVEALLLFPFALLYIIYAEIYGGGSFASSFNGGALLALSGLVTTVPLLLFGACTARLRYATVGFLLYITPTLQLALAVFAFGEPFTSAHGLSFGFIWAGLFLYSADAVRGVR